MNLSEFVAEDNSATVTAVDNEWELSAFNRIVLCICLALGIPGNILSATVWLRLHKKNSSAVYLTALAINDLVFLPFDVAALSLNVFESEGWFFLSVRVVWVSAATIEPLLVFCFALERLLAICWPLRVRL